MVLPPPGDRGTIELVARMQRGEDAAWRELYDRYRDELLLAIRCKMGDRLRSLLQSDDVLQSVALAAFEALPGFRDRGKGSLRGFLHLLVQRKLADRARHLGRSKRAGAVPLTDSVADAVAAPALPTYTDPRYLQLERCLLALPAEMREVIRLRRFEGLSGSEAAARMGRSDDAVRKLHSRAVARLSLLLQEQGP